MSSSVSRLNLSIDSEFRKILDYFRSRSPLMSDGDIIKMIVGSYFVESNQKDIQRWSSTLPELTLTEDQQKDIQESLNSGFDKTWNSEDFAKLILED